MKIYSIILVTILVLTTRLYGQEIDPSAFKIYVDDTRFFPKSANHFNTDKANFSIGRVLVQGGIVVPGTHNVVSPDLITRYLVSKFPDVNQDGILVLDWEGEVFAALKKPKTEAEFLEGEKLWLQVISIVRKVRPRLKIGVYGLPFRGFNNWTLTAPNPPHQLDNLFNAIDFIAPSLYLIYADEQVGHERNLQYLRDNLNYSLKYGKRFNKPVIVFMWHRLHPGNKYAPHAIISKSLFAKHVKLVATYEVDGFKASGMFWWEDGWVKDRLSDLQGLNNWLNGKVYDLATYDALTLDFAKTTVAELNE